MRIRLLDESTQKDIVSCQMFTCYSDVVYFVVYKIITGLPTCIQITYQTDSLQFIYDGGGLSETDGQDYLHNVCVISKLSEGGTNRILLKELFERFPVRKKLFTSCSIVGEVKKILQHLSIVLFNTKFILKTTQPSMIVMLVQSRQGEQQQMISQRLSTLVNHPDHVSISRTQEFSLYCFTPTDVKLKMAICSLNYREVKCPMQIKKVLKKHFNNGYLIYIRLQLSEDVFQIYKRQLWIYNIDPIVQKLDQLLSIVIRDKESLTKPTGTNCSGEKIIKEQYSEELEELATVRNRPTQRRLQVNEFKKRKICSLTQTNEQQRSQDNRTISKPMMLGLPRPTIKIQDFGKLKPRCQFYKGFIIAELNLRLYMIDQHAASQKIFYEGNLSAKTAECYLTATVPANCEGSLGKWKAELRGEGWEFQVFVGEKMLRVQLSGVPQYAEYKCTGKDFQLRILEGKAELDRKIQRLIATYACHQAYRVGDILDVNQIKVVLSSLSKIHSPYNCPHGRPTIIEIASAQSLIDKVTQPFTYQL